MATRSPISGCHLIEADKLGHQVMLPGGEAYDAIVREFGRDILDAEGRISRRKLSGMVWEHPERLEKLNQPGPSAGSDARGRRRWPRSPERDPHAIVVVEAAILVETGRYKSFDRLIVVTCTSEQQMERALGAGFV